MSAVVLLLYVTTSRLAELALARVNTRRLLAAGGRELDPAHYGLIVAVHALWLATLWWWGPGRPVAPGWLALFLVLQALRAWVLLTLGRRWTTRIVVVPGETLVARGPYRIMNHPNYAVVVGEIAVLPLALGLPLVAILFSLLNAAVLALRIPAENRALAGLRRGGG